MYLLVSRALNAQDLPPANLHFHTDNESTIIMVPYFGTPLVSKFPEVVMIETISTLERLFKLPQEKAFYHYVCLISIYEKNW